ncbi:N-acetylmuramoyl-L-alanine amidase [Carnobacterium sp. FSL E2-0243]|uniref:N-acetylmuramoyl-L-alanine amidase n=1 Tax=Carnobacterium sp. FSL E2-0243 TaxID=2921365 RepID=UPI0030F84483
MTIKTAHAGHGGIDPGAVGNGRKEAEVARLYNSKIIQLTGAVNATDDTATSVNDNLNKIVAKVNAVSGNDDWNLSIHLNAATPAATGVEVFAYSSDSAGMAKAAEISAKLANVYGIPNRGAKAGDGLFVIKNTKGHMLLIELGFISNANDLNQVLNKIDAACNAIVGSFGYNGGTAPTPSPAPQVPSGTQVKVVGLTADMQRLNVPQFQQKYAGIYLANKIHGFAKGGIELNSIPQGHIDTIYNSLITDYKIPAAQVKKVNSTTIHVIGLADDTQRNWIPQFQKKYAGIYLGNDINGNFHQTIELNNIPTGTDAAVIRKSLAEDFKIPEHQIK